MDGLIELVKLLSSFAVVGLAGLGWLTKILIERSSKLNCSQIAVLLVSFIGLLAGVIFLTLSLREIAYQGLLRPEEQTWANESLKFYLNFSL